MIRVANKDDLEAVYRLMRQLSDHDFTREQFAACYRHNLKGNCIVVYEEDGDVYGCGVLSIHYPMHFSRKNAEIVNLIVEANVRNRGIGKMILNELERIATENECARIEVASNKRRTDAHRFYIREGFADTHIKMTKEIHRCSKRFIIFQRLKC